MAKLKKFPVYTQEEITKLGQEYADLSAQIKVLETRKKELSDIIKSGAEKYGVKDDKGSFYFETDSLILGKVAKKSYKLDSDVAIPTLKEMGLEDVVDVITTEVVNEDKLSAAVSSGRISLNDVEKFTKTSTSYSVSVKKREEVTAEVEQSTLAPAAKRRK